MTRMKEGEADAVGRRVCDGTVTKSNGKGILTALEDLDLLNSSLVKEGAGLENLEVLVAAVGHNGLDLRVPNLLERDRKGRFIALGHVDSRSTGGSGEGHTGKELHCEGKQDQRSNEGLL